MLTFLPSKYPTSPRPLRNALTTGVASAGERLLRNPTTGFADCCARAVTGHTAAEPISANNSRRFIFHPGVLAILALHCARSQVTSFERQSGEQVPVTVT